MSCRATPPSIPHACFEDAFPPVNAVIIPRDLQKQGRKQQQLIC